MKIIGDHGHSSDELTLAVSNGDGEFDSTIFEFQVFEDGCYWFKGSGFGVDKFTVGQVKEQVVHEICRDAEAVGYFSFDPVLVLDEPVIPPNALFIRNGDHSRMVTYSPIRTRDQALRAVGQGVVQERDMVVCHLLAERILDIASAVR
jgi:hypothetical protein